ncbi:CBS domain-containing protein [Nonomuraea sp. NPDC004354]
MRATVQDVMTTGVAAVEADAPFHVIAELLIARGVSGVPVVDDTGHVLGVVSEADLLCKQEFKERYYGDVYRPPLRARLRHRTGTPRKATGETARELMTSPAVVTTPGSSVVSAARLMDARGVKRLPVVDADGRLVGVVSRRDLLKVFVRRDEDIRAEVVRALGARTAARVDVVVEQGVVTMTGTTGTLSEALLAVRDAENVEGVVAVHDQVTWGRDDVGAADLPTWDGA